MSAIVIPEYVMRMAEELNQLEDRIDKLELFMARDFELLSYEKQILMKIQLNSMKSYALVLKRRLDICAKECNDE